MKRPVSTAIALLTVACLFVLSPLFLRAQEPARQEATQQLRDGDVIAVCGDSITEQVRYSLLLGTYLAVCQPRNGLTVLNFGAGGETAEHFLASGRAELLVPSFRPSVVTVCYGMNDCKTGGADIYRKNMDQILPLIQKSGARFIITASPGVVDTATFNTGDPIKRNAILAEIGAAAKELARTHGTAFADIHSVMAQAMRDAKARYGQSYHVAGSDGVHPEMNGALVMACVLLKALGCDGCIGTISVDMQSGKATATDGHKIVSFAQGRLVLESSRYPFCFTGDPASPNATSGMIEFIPFNKDLNRFILKVANPPAPRIRVAWGEHSKVLAAEQLSTGVNLAEEFLQNPFSEPFAKVQARVQKQQKMLLQLTAQKSLLSRAAQNRKSGADPTGKAFEQTCDAIKAFEAQVRAEAYGNVPPVQHTLLLSAEAAP